ncbi:MAG: hypothetical protein FWC23_04945 [Chitinispirillia bacterium]|nr:hypothetical protein [Chitinispirillia bacterium]MCL2268514.1 hypothetical protein [Chitinispirillia bacterium]
MIKLPLAGPFFAVVLVVLSTAAAVFARPFARQYNRLGAPFAVFYDPSLLGSNPGYTLGFDMRTDSAGYDVRGALIIPVSRVMTRGEFLRENTGTNRHFRYANQSYRSSKSAVSVGGIYSGPDNYQISAGLVAPVYLVQSGVSFDVNYRGNEPVGGVNAAFSMDMPGIMRNRMLYLGFNNLVVSDRDGANDLNIAVGTAGMLMSEPWTVFTPYDLSLVSYIKGGIVRLVEGTACINLDLTMLRTSGDNFGQLPAGAVGYTMSRKRGGETSHRFFVNFGITFVNRASSAAVLGGYGWSKGLDDKNAAIFYSSFGRSEAVLAESDMQAELSCRDAGGGKYLFSLGSAGPHVKSWVLRIEDPRGGSVTTFSGGNVLPSSVLWDGLRGDGSAVSEEAVFARLVLVGDTKVVESKTVEIPLKR